MRYILFLVLTVLGVQGAMGQNILRGSPSSLKKQNEVADKEGLTRMGSPKTIRKYVESNRLVPIPDGKHGIVVDRRLDKSRRYCRPWTVQFLKDLGENFRKKFGKNLQVNSCVRDVNTQKSLRGTNLNAAPAKGSKASSHLTGSTFDITRLALSKKEQDYVRSRLVFHEELGNIEATQENWQAVWHVMVFRRYTTK